MRKQLLGEDHDLALLQAMARGDSLALEELYRRRGPRLLAYLVGRLNDAGLAEEVLSGCDAICLAKRGAFSGRVPCVHLAVRHCPQPRHQRVHRQQSASSPPLSIEDRNLDWIGEESPEIEKVSAYEAVHAALQALPEEQNETLELVFFHGLSLNETAYVLRISTGTVKSRLHRAKAHVRAIMESEAKSNE